MKKYLYIKNLKNRKEFKKIEKKKLILKFLFYNLLNNKKLSSNGKRLIIYNINRFYFNYFKYSKSIINTRCVVTNRGRGTFKKFGLSRVILRDFMAFGIIPGYKKAVW